MHAGARLRGETARWFARSPAEMPAFPGGRSPATKARRTRSVGGAARSRSMSRRSQSVLPESGSVGGGVSRWLSLSPVVRALRERSEPN